MVGSVPAVVDREAILAPETRELADDLACHLALGLLFLHSLNVLLHHHQFVQYHVGCFTYMISWLSLVLTLIICQVDLLFI